MLSEHVCRVGDTRQCVIFGIGSGHAKMCWLNTFMSVSEYLMLANIFARQISIIKKDIRPQYLMSANIFAHHMLKIKKDIRTQYLMLANIFAR